MPAEGVKLLHHSDILSFEEIAKVVEVGQKHGINKIRLTGGEPLVRKGIVELVKMISQVDGIDDIGLTTNGIFLDKYATQLKEAGLNRVNISLDTLSPEKYKEITRGGDIQKVFDGINAARKAGLTPIKINCVVFKSSNEEDAKQVAEFCVNNNLQIRFIHQMNLSNGEFSVVEGGEGGNCKICNRLRLTANGDIKPCLFSDLKYNIRQLGIEKAFEMAVANKPKHGTFSNQNQFYTIGG
jgi:cyclic pyranopterin phosphate synthase